MECIMYHERGSPKLRCGRGMWGGAGVVMLQGYLWCRDIYGAGIFMVQGYLWCRDGHGGHDGRDLGGWR